MNDVYINIQWYQNWRTLHPTVHCSAVFAALVVQLPVEVRLGAEIILVEGLNATCRASLALYNNEEDIDQLVDALKFAFTLID